MYVPTLLESKRRANKGKLLGVGFASLTIHTAVIAGIVYATLHASRPDNTVKMDTTVVLLAPQHDQKLPQQQPAQLDIPLKGFQTVAVVPEVPTTLPPVDLTQHFDPKDYSGTGVEGGKANGLVPGENQVYAEAVVEEKPALLSGRRSSIPSCYARPASRGAWCCARSSTPQGGSSPPRSRSSRAQAPASTSPPNSGRSRPCSVPRGCTVGPCARTSTSRSIIRWDREPGLA